MRTSALLCAALLAGSRLIPAVPLQAQAAPDTLKACFVNGSGSVYRVGVEKAPATCTKSSHVPFSWTRGGSGGGGVSAHNQLAGLAADDHAQYLLTEGVRQSVNGFAVTGTFGKGTLPASGPGARLMWYPGKAAFRAGNVFATEWDDGNIGPRSIALGTNTIASGEYATALGTHANATAFQAMAIGSSATASGNSSTAMGYGTTASGAFSTAMGVQTTASGSHSTAMGTLVSTGDKAGSFIYGDAASGSQVAMNSTTNQFAVRAQHIWLGANSSVTNTSGRFLEVANGAYLTWGGTWTNSSDVNRKHLFQPIDGEQVLRKVAALPISSWSYKDDEATVRHIGPTAQDFHRAFGLGDSDKAIATVDADGVSLAAIQALEQRTRAQEARIEALQRQSSELLRRLAALEGRR